jgi:hypothetical protein
MYPLIVTDFSEEHVASIFRVQETSMKQEARRTLLVEIASRYQLTSKPYLLLV